MANGGTDLNGDGTIDSADYLQYAESNNLKIYKPLGLFEITPVGLLIMGVGIAYLMLFGRRLLPDYPDESLAEGFNIREYHSEIVVMPGSRLIGQRVFESSLAEMEFRIVKVLRKKRSFVPNTRSVIEEGDVLLVSGSMEDLMAVKDASGIEIHAETKLEDEALQTDDVKIAELLITPKSTLIRRTLKEANFRQRFGLAVLAIYRHGQSLGRKLGVIRLRAGDLLLVQGSEERLLSLEHGTNLLRLDATEAPSADRRQKGFRALVFFGLAVIAGGLGLAPLPICFLSAAALTVATRCITMQKVYEVIDWRVLIVIGGMTAFGAAMRESGTAQWLAGGIQSISENPRTVLAGFILLTMLLTQAMSNAAAALVVLPVAMQTAGTLGVSGQTFAIAVMLGASSSFIAPFEPACILVSGPGKYRFTDYLKAGLGLTLIMGFLVWLMVPYWCGVCEADSTLPEVFGQLGQGAGAVADGVFHLAAKLGEAEFVAVRNEQRIVAEAALADLRLGNSASANALERPDFRRLAKRDQRQHTVKLRTTVPVGDVGQLAPQLGVVRVVGCIARRRRRIARSGRPARRRARRPPGRSRPPTRSRAAPGRQAKRRSPWPF